MQRRLTQIFGAMPLAHRVVTGVAVVVFAMAAFLFMRWVASPSLTVLYTDLDDQSLSLVVDELERQGVDYRIEAGGSRVLVPRSQVYRVRGDLAIAGVRNGLAPTGYELLDEQGLNVSDFRQRIDYRRALEGELSKTLLAMNDVSMAQVHLVIPDRPLFTDQEEPVTASVLLDTTRPLGDLEVEAVTFVVSSAVEGLEPANVTVADVKGHVLHAAGEATSGSGSSNRNIRATRDLEAALAADVRNLLSAVVGPDAAWVVVRADLDFDEESIETETFDPETAVALREQTVNEQFDGTASAPGGPLGVDGDQIAAAGDDYTYQREEATREFGVDRVVSRVVTAPGGVRQLSVAVLLDDGSLTDAPVPPVDEVEALVAAALGLDPERGDVISVSQVAFPAVTAGDETPGAVAASLDLMGMLPQFAGIVVLLVVAITLMLMTRTGRKRSDDEDTEAATETVDGASTDLVTINAGVEANGGDIHSDVMGMVQRQPEEIAALLREWLADPR